MFFCIVQRCHDFFFFINPSFYCIHQLNVTKLVLNGVTFTKNLIKREETLEKVTAILEKAKYVQHYHKSVQMRISEFTFFLRIPKRNDIHLEEITLFISCKCLCVFFIWWWDGLRKNIYQDVYSVLNMNTNRVCTL